LANFAELFTNMNSLISMTIPAQAGIKVSHRHRLSPVWTLEKTMTYIRGCAEGAKWG